MRLALFVSCKNTFSEGLMGKHCRPSAPDIGAAAMSRKLKKFLLFAYYQLVMRKACLRIFRAYGSRIIGVILE